jgi:hypothetical protein
MSYVFLAHRTIGSMLLPLLLLIAAIWFTVTWKPDRWPARAAQFFRILIGLQFLLGLAYWVAQLLAGAGAYYLAFPFLLHPLMGLLATVLTQIMMRPVGPFARLGRWAPLAAFGISLLLVMAAVIIVYQV